MTRVLLTLCISTWTVGCASPKVAPQETVLSAEEICVPVQMHVRGPLIDVHINDRGPFKFLFDTGVAAPVVLDNALAEELGLTRRPEIKIVATTPINHEFKLDGTVEIASLRIPGAEFRTLIGATHDLSELSDGIDGILGMDLFVDCGVVTIDLAASRIRLSTQSLARDGALRFQPRVRTPTIPVSLSDGVSTLRFAPTIDTGAVVALCVPASAHRFLQDHRPMVLTSWGPPVLVTAGILEASFSIAPDIIIERPDVILINGPGLLGVDFLKDYVVSIDMANRLVRIRASTSTQ